jgi:hypothetical protein
MSSSTEPNQRTAPPEWGVVLALSVLIVAAASVPYWLAYAVPPEHVFAGFLINPADGNSYFAKMREGLRGEWLFTLPYTAEPGPGAFIFTYYLFLGHVARWTGLSLDVIYHGARVLGGLALLLTAYAFVAHFFATRRARLAVWALYALGSGLGWLVVPFGLFTADLWVAEAIPFLAVLSNAHFALATALLLWLALWTVPGLSASPAGPGRWLLIVLATTALAQVLPMALLNVVLLLAGVCVWWVLTQRPATLAAWVRAWAPAALFGAAALPWLIHALALTLQHPMLRQWNAQNQTPSPPLWDTAVAGGGLLLLAVPGVWLAARRRTPREMLLLLWLGLGALALYAPFSLQRRLSLGLWMPLALLAGLGLREVVWPRVKPAWRPLAAAGLGVSLLASNALVYAATLGAIASRDPAVFLTRGQAQGLAWLAAHGGRALVAAPPEWGLWVPARSDARVLYGHPFETVDAAQREAEVTAFYAGVVPGPAFVAKHNVAYVLAPDDDPAWTPPAGWQWPVAFKQAGIVIYASQP